MKTSSGANAGSYHEMGRPDRGRFQADEEHNLENDSATEVTRKYAGIGPESVAVYAEQSCDLEVPLSLRFSLAEDISYKLRYVIHDALVKARLSGRNYILSSDVEATFENLSIEKVFGAETTPTWIPLGDQSITYLDDSTVNLIELAEEETSYIQPAAVIVKRKWIPDAKDAGGATKRYFETLCFAIVSNDLEVRRAALRDVRENNYIGPVVEWFYHFGYFLLSKDITYDSLTLTALDLIRCLEENPVAPQIVSENQLKLFVRLILQRVLRSTTTVEVLKPMCRVLALLSDRIPIRELVTLKLSQKIDELKQDFALPIVTLVNELGGEDVGRLLEPNLDYFLARIERNWDGDLIDGLLTSYALAATEKTASLSAKYYRIFQDALVPLWKCPSSPTKVERPETNWRNMKAQLLRSRRKVTHRTKRKTRFRAFEEVFPEVSARPPFAFKLLTNVAAGRQRFLNMCDQPAYSVKPNSVVVGKRVLSLRVSTTVGGIATAANHPRCYDHTMSAVII